MFRQIVGSGSRGKNQPEVLGHSSRQGLEPENALNLNGLLCAIWCYPANTLVLGVLGRIDASDSRSRPTVSLSSRTALASSNRSSLKHSHTSSPISGAEPKVRESGLAAFPAHVNDRDPSSKRKLVYGADIRSARVVHVVRGWKLCCFVRRVATDPYGFVFALIFDVDLCQYGPPVSATTQCR